MSAFCAIAANPDVARAPSPLRRLESKAEVEEGQDWPLWCREKWLDFACPMTYVESADAFREHVGKCRSALPSGFPVYPGIGLNVWKDEELDCSRFADQVSVLREMGFGGFAVFELTKRLEKINAASRS